MIFWVYMGLSDIFLSHDHKSVLTTYFSFNNNLKQIDLLLIFTLNFLG